MHFPSNLSLERLIPRGEAPIRCLYHYTPGITYPAPDATRWFLSAPVPIVRMPPRRSSHLRHLPLIRSNPSESMESRIKRLRPGGQQEQPVATPAPALEHSSSEPRAKASAITSTRSDVPLVRNVTRGSASEATAAFRQHGIDALLDELVHDRIVQSGVASTSSLLSTWQYCHKLPFAD